MSDVEKSRTATEFQSITEADGPSEDTNENMEDDVFGNNESTKQQKDQGDKNEVPNSSPQPSHWRKDQEDAQENAGVLGV